MSQTPVPRFPEALPLRNFGEEISCHAEVVFVALAPGKFDNVLTLDDEEPYGYPITEPLSSSSDQGRMKEKGLHLKDHFTTIFPPIYSSIQVYRNGLRNASANTEKKLHGKLLRDA
ncbi:hypothetical protein NLJ89_g2198 [Agrocybe chaxingu]|uniref:Uncharacterized protein n=1 Tax=Agrocybe chaxingu TaxID=84603 RepID=A0A9W8K725_9AGAR|nr:hypothetical protein NLJ89_g2198 [Agrocybe chaxingu]